MDSFNINIVSSIIVIDPYYILGIVTGCIGIYILTSLDIRTTEVFTKLLLQRIKKQVLRKINQDEYEPPIEEIATDMMHIGLINQVFNFYIPVSPPMLTIDIFGDLPSLYPLWPKNGCDCALWLFPARFDHLLP